LVERVIIYQQRAQQALLGLDIMRHLPEIGRLRLNRGV
jgi:hypothetical protein